MPLLPIRFNGRRLLITTNRPKKNRELPTSK
jgi:hypothetical protein